MPVVPLGPEPPPHAVASSASAASGLSRRACRVDASVRFTEGPLG
jgi:hypothetical protein